MELFDIKHNTAQQLLTSLNIIDRSATDAESILDQFDVIEMIIKQGRKALDREPVNVEVIEVKEVGYGNH